MSEAGPRMGTPGQRSRAKELLRLARAEFGSQRPARLTRNERRLLRCAAMGAECTARDAQRGPGLVRASVIRWLCADDHAARLVDPRGLMLRCAIIADELNLEGIRVPFRLGFFNCDFRGGVEIGDAQTQIIVLNGSYTTKFRADRARIEGTLSLAEGFFCAGECSMVGATISGDLLCSGATFHNPGKRALNGDALNVCGSVFLRHQFHAEGEVRLRDATIGKILDFTDGTFRNPGRCALGADSVNVGGSVFLKGSGIGADGVDRRFNAVGAVRLSGATIGGDVVCTAGTFLHPGGAALHGDAMNVRGSVFLRHPFRAEGGVRLLSATIGGILDCTGGTFSCPGRSALAADRIIVRGSIFICDILGWTGRLILIGASCASYVDDDESLKKVQPILLDRFRFAEFGAISPRDGRARAEWIKQVCRASGREGEDRFVPSAYTAVAAALSRMGHEDDAREVLIALERERHAHEYWGDKKQNARPWWAAVYWRRALDWLEAVYRYVFVRLRYICKFAVRYLLDYGYDPWRPAWFMLGFLLIGWLVFALGYSAGHIAPASEQVLTWSGYAAAPGERVAVEDRSSERPEVEALLPPDYPAFNPLVYSLDALLPIIDLHQERYWLPRANEEWLSWAGPLRFYLWFHIIAGWTLTTFLIAGVTGLIKHRPPADSASGPHVTSA